MRVRIFSTAIQQISSHVAREHPREACGLLLGQGNHIEAVIESPNVADDPNTEFEIDPTLLFRVHREARDGRLAILGWYHSHPDGHAEPSSVDAARAVEDGKLWMIVANGDVRLFAAGAGPIRGRFFEAALDVVST